MIETWINTLSQCLVLWLLVLAALVARDVFFRAPPTGLLRRLDGSQAEPERIALLAVTMGFAFYYLLTALQTPIDDLIVDGVPTMPDVSTEMLVVLFGTQGGFLFGKALRLIELEKIIRIIKGV